MAWPVPDPPPLTTSNRLQNTGLKVRGAPRFRVFGVPVKIHFSFILVVLWSGWQGWLRYQEAGGILYGVVAVALLFGSVLVHEIAHAVQARAVGWHVYGVTLTPVGGVAQVATRPAEAFHEFTVAAAGPSANLGLAILFGAVAYFVQPFALFSWNQYFLADFPALRGITLYLFAINVLLAATNMLPIFPMDGAHVLAAVIKLLGATPRTATRVVRAFGWVSTLLLLGGAVAAAVTGLAALALLFVVLASVVYFGTRQETRRLHRYHALTHLRVGQLPHRVKVVTAPEQILTHVVQQKAFKEAAVIPVLKRGELIGLLLYHQARQVAARMPQATVAHTMQTRFPALAPEDTLIRALELMTESDIPSLPIESKGHFFGMISLIEVERTLRRFNPNSK